MAELKQVRGFVLGAGCSAQCGYPLGVGLGQQLQEYLRELPAECTRIKQCVNDTIALMRTYPDIETFDQLAKQVEDDFHAWSTQRGVADQTYRDRERLADRQILEAKIATSALFVARETEARKRGLPGYARLLDSLFGGEPWQEAVNSSNCHVLSFNYDRALEIAFLNHFKSLNPQQRGIYSGSVLNSGFNDRVNGGHDRVEPTSGRFCFLKLHGSAGWWVKKAAGIRGHDECRRYWPAIPSGKDDLQKVEQLLEQNDGPDRAQPWEPLIAFPHERQRARKGETDFLADHYLRKIQAHAADILATATEVRIIGYSFALIDSRHVVNDLLNNIPRDSRIVVQNMDVARVRERLDAYPSIRSRRHLEFDPTPF